GRPFELIHSAQHVITEEIRGELTHLEPREEAMAQLIEQIRSAQHVITEEIRGELIHLEPRGEVMEQRVGRIHSALRDVTNKQLYSCNVSKRCSL
ncbi:MAG: hypothetical protein ACTSV1_03720, partial [Alphaproteobacteria bacterium]